MRAARFGLWFALVAGIPALAAAAPAAADPEPPVVLIPGGPPIVHPGPYEGSGVLGPPVSVKPGCVTGFSRDTTGDVTHPVLGAGVYEFHVQLCLHSLDDVSGTGTFALHWSNLSVSGKLIMPPSSTSAPYTYQMTATGGCKAHFRAEGTAFIVSGPPPPILLDEDGTLTQFGAIVCRAGR